METTRHLGLECVALRNAAVELLVTRSVGPRILYLGLRGQPNLFAELPQLTLDCPGAEEKFYAYGGHRLWHAPQMPARTHMPDNGPVQISPIAHGVDVVQPAEPQTGIEKSLRIQLPGDDATIWVDHTLTNRGLWPVTTAPWAITELRAGGLGIAPQTQAHDDPDGTWPNRSIALWPFTDIASPHIRWGNRFLFVTATMKEGMLKFGFPNPDGWLAYAVDGTLFVKQAAFDRHAMYFDRGSSSQIFCMPGFIELETQGPRTLLAPSASVTHREVWRLYAGIAPPADEEAMAALASAW
jgi:hypothetical protein